MQRVALAVALVTRPPLVLLDEPTSQLDPVAGDELIWLLRRLNEEWGVAVVLAEHRIERCLAAADRVIAMDGGRIGFDGGPREFLEYAIAADPALATPAARMFSCAGIDPLPVGVRDARATLRVSGIKVGTDAGAAGRRLSGHTSGADRHRGEALSRSKSLWVELDPGDGPVDVLRSIDLEIQPGRTGRAHGKKRCRKINPSADSSRTGRSGSRERSIPRGIALLTQNPGDYLVRERIADELPGPAGEAALARSASTSIRTATPATCPAGNGSGWPWRSLWPAGWKAKSPGLIALDEPTRGMDRGLKDDLTGWPTGCPTVVPPSSSRPTTSSSRSPSRTGSSCSVTAKLIADADTGTILSGGWYFASEVARVLDRPGLVAVGDGAMPAGWRNPAGRGRP